MKILETNRLLRISGHYYRPFVRHVVSEWEAMQLAENHAACVSVGSMNPWERRCNGEVDLNNRKVLLYRHAAFGDQLMATSVARYLRHLYPDNILTVYCHDDVMCIWEGNRDITGGYAVPFPIPFDVVNTYDYHIFFEAMLESNKEPDQRNAYDDMFNFLGLRDVPPAFKRPFITEKPEDYHGLDFDFSEPYVVYHTAPANANRRYPHAKGAATVRLIVERFRGMKVVLVGLEKTEEWRGHFGPVADAYPDNVFSVVNATRSFRSLIPIIRNATAVVCPDSSVGHLAAAFPEVPAVSLWGLFHPRDRVKYYKNHIPIWNDNVCPHAPCHNHDFSLPLDYCRDACNATEDIRHCCVLESITPEQIVKALEPHMVRRLNLGTETGGQEDEHVGTVA